MLDALLHGRERDARPADRPRRHREQPRERQHRRLQGPAGRRSRTCSTTSISSNQGATQGQQMGLGVAISGIQAQFDEGAAQTTGVATDFMITQGAGFFAVTQAGRHEGLHPGRQLRLRRRRPARDAERRPGARPQRPADPVPEDDEDARDRRRRQPRRGHAHRPHRRSPSSAWCTFANPAGLTLNGGNQYLESADSGNPTRVVSGGVGGSSSRACSRWRTSRPSTRWST